MPPRINLVAFENGVGNSRDIVLLAAALRELACEVTITVVSRHARRRRKIGLVRAFAASRMRRSQKQSRTGAALQFDANVMLEHIWPEQLHRARRNIIVPNPEYFDRHDRAQLSAIDCVWAKTTNTLELFVPLRRPTVLTGFHSENRYQPELPREAKFLHGAGKSPMKGTERLIEIWARHPQWPTLTVVQSLARRAPRSAIPNVEFETRFLADSALRELQNRHRFHLCTSETEGWGHYIAEALSVGAIVLATDAAPMNELVTRERGLLVAAQASRRQHLATLYQIDEIALERAVERALSLSEAQQQCLAEQGRSWFEDNKRNFLRRLSVALQSSGATQR